MNEPAGNENRTLTYTVGVESSVGERGGDGEEPSRGEGMRLSAAGRRRLAHATRGPLLAALLALTSYCAACAIRGTAPFGSRSRAINDLANQFVPFHAHFWDLVHGRGSGDLFLNWDSGYGASFLPDFHTYLMNPFSWLVVLFPRESIDDAVFWVTPLSMAMGAALMTRYLGMISKGPWWQRAVLGAAYGTCAWALDDASPDPMWLWGLASLPLMCVAVEWCLRGRRWVWASVFVAFSWGGNFYTAIMATIGAGIVFAVRSLSEDLTWRHRALSAGRAVSAVGVGVLLTLPLLWPSYLASKNAQPAPMGVFDPVAGDVYLSQMLPATRPLVTAPKFFVGTFALLLVLTLPFNRALSRRVRVSWSAGLVLTGISYVWEPTQKLWHGMDVPNGSPYRAMFVLSGLLVMGAWLSLSHRPRVFAVLGAAAAILTVALWADAVPAVQMEYTWWALAIGVPTALIVLVAPRLSAGRFGARATGVLGAGLAVVAVSGFAVETAVSAVAVDDYRDRLDFFAPKPDWDERHDAKYAVTRGAGDWPAHRTDTGPNAFANNDVMLFDGESAQYYSSYVTAETATTLRRFGHPWWMSGRYIGSVDNPVTDAIFSVGARVRATAPGSAAFRVTRSPVPPMVTVHPDDGTAPADGVFAWQNAALGTPVHAIPPVEATGPQGPIVAAGTGAIPMKARANVRLVARCAPGTTAYLSAPYLSADVRMADTTVRIRGRATGTSAPVVPLGTVPATGDVVAELAVKERGFMPRAPIGCLDEAVLGGAVKELTAGGARSVTATGHRIEARLPEASTGTAVLAIPAGKGWSCERDGSAVSAIARYGLLAVPLGAGASDVACSFTPPGLAKGALAGGVGLLTLIAVWAGARHTRRRRRDEEVDLKGPVLSA